MSILNYLIPPHLPELYRAVNELLYPSSFQGSGIPNSIYWRTNKKGLGNRRAWRRKDRKK